MSSHWGIVDGLIRELGSLRNDARALDSPPLDRTAIAEVERLIGHAAEAVDDTLDGTENEDLLVSACEAIIVARDRMASLSSTLSRSRHIVARSVDLRRESARLLYERIRGSQERR